MRGARARAGPARNAKVVLVDIDAALRPIEVEGRYERVLLVVTSRRGVLGQVMVPAEPVLTVQAQWSAIAGELEELLWLRRVRAAFERAARGPETEQPASEEPSVSVIVCTRDRPQDLRRCLDSLGALRTAPREVLVVDNCPSNQATRRLCEDYPVKYLVEPIPGTSRAKNRGLLEAAGHVVAFVDDDCVVDPRWLDELGDPFDDPLVMGLIGYAGPLELETSAQCLFEGHGGFQHYPERRVFDGAAGSPVTIAGSAGAGANSLFRRRVFDEVGLFAEDLGPGTPARGAEDKYALYRIADAGYRIVFDPARIVWHRHRREHAALRRTLFGYTVGEFAYTTRCLLAHHQPGVLRSWAWWPRHLARDLRRLRRGDEGAIPLDLLLSEAAGIPVGPWKLWRSRRSRARIPAHELPGRTRGGDEKPRGGAVSVTDSEAPRLSVVIASRNRRERLGQALTALARQRYPRDRFETVVVLDGSTDGSAELARALDLPYRLTLLEQENRGLAATRNRGARAASHPVVVFLDDDIVPVPDFLAEHAGAHQRTGRHVALGYYPPVIDEASLWAYAVRSWWEDHFRRKAEPDHQWTFIDFSDGNSSMPVDLLLEHGGYDEDFKGRRQDWELAIRLLRGGVVFGYYPAAKGLHHADLSFATALRHARQEARDDVLLGSKHPHVIGQLPLGGMAGAGPTAPRRLRAVYERRDAAERVLRSGPAAAATLERLQLRVRWHRLAHQLLRLSYMLGLTEALPTPGRFDEFLGPTWRGEATVSLPVWLDDQGSLRLPPGAGAVDLQLGYAGVPVARIRAMDSAGQWDWREVTDRAVGAARSPLRRAILLDQDGLGGSTSQPR